MNPYEIFNEQELNLIKKLENIENKNYTNTETKLLENKILEDVMSRSSKDGAITKAREEYSNIIDKLEKINGNII